ncbi:MAG: flavodoxin-dependent (E)-4-hydroxy-3-methylbut-2-enyl-diphosphate synthase [Syntrophomonadaceae bacterium]|nr:flavodoxin-dependent (E)-4-hydroxy-3-methylbut-2-enyl-diphosphate synthase [Syntrophomonadaceae bacterium]
MRRPTRQINIGSAVIGGDNPIVVQSMTNTDPRDVEATSRQIAELAQIGCEVVRVAIPDAESAECLKEIRANSTIPIVADIHFDYRLALMSLEAGADGLRINPGNIGARSRVEMVVSAAKERNIPIRIGVNAGSLDKDLLKQFGGATPEAMVESALRQIGVLEELNYDLIKISLKSSDVLSTVKAYRLLSDRVDYPFHIGITEAGTLARGLIKSSLGIGMLLAEGIGDTIRVSLTADPKEEVWAAYEILRAVGSRARGVELISCPTCGRCEIDLQTLAEQADRELRGITVPLKVAVMGCVVNGPGEARDAHVGIAGGRGFGLLFKEGKIIERVEKDKMLSKLLETVYEIVHEEGQV